MIDLKEDIRRFNFLSKYNVSQPEAYISTNNLRDMINVNNYHFNYKILKEMKNGVFHKYDNLFEVIPSVKEILKIDEAYQTYSNFMMNLGTDAKSLKSSSNAIQKTYNKFVNGISQHWYLIEPEEYIYALKRYEKIQSDLSDNYWAKKIFEWEDGVKSNIQQFISNSYLVSGPTLDPRTYNENGENLLNLLWYNLSGDDSIPYRREDLSKSHADREFIRKYWSPFVDYIGTKFGDDVDSYETDAPLEGLFNLVAEFDKNKMDYKKNLVTLNKLIDMVHGRGSLSHLFIRGGISSLDKISGYKKKM